MMYILAPPRRSTPQGQLQKSSVPTYLTVNVLPHWFRLRILCRRGLLLGQNSHLQLLKYSLYLLIISQCFCLTHNSVIPISKLANIIHHCDVVAAVIRQWVLAAEYDTSATVISGGGDGNYIWHMPGYFALHILHRTVSLMSWWPKWADCTNQDTRFAYLSFISYFYPL